MTTTDFDSNVYVIFGAFFGIVAAIATFAYLIGSWGILLAVLFAWFPALAVGTLVAITWPAILLVAMALYFGAR